jgi:acyl-CoA synthetase (AMP-forming)/AMP-acid ligase II
MVQWSAATYGDREAIVDGKARLTFTEVGREMERVAKALIAIGVQPGDRVGLWDPNSVGWIPVALGIQAAGAWLVPINTRMKGAEVAFILEKTDAAAVFAPGMFLGTDYQAVLAESSGDLRALQHSITVPGPGEYGGTVWEEFLAGGDAVPDDVLQARIDAIGPDDISDVIFTSGTTGTPKGVMLRHGTSLDAFGRLNDSYDLQPTDRYMIITPFFHCMGYKSGWMLSLMVGATTYPVAVFDVEEALRFIQDDKITYMPGSPTVYSALLDHPSRADFDLSSLRCAMVSAASVPAALVHRMADELGIRRVFTGYGITENHAIVAFTQPDDAPEVIASSVGKLLGGVTCRIVDDEGNDLPFGEQGEILLSGDMVMSGYYGEPEVTASTVVDGWLHTGDIGTIDERQYMRVTDRKKDMYIMGGFNVAPAEVEKALLGMDKISQVAVIGIPDEKFGEVGMAFVIPREGVSLTEDEVIDYAKPLMANYKVPRKVAVVEAFPLNATGKVLKGDLRHAAKEMLPS